MREKLLAKLQHGNLGRRRLSECSEHEHVSLECSANHELSHELKQQPGTQDNLPCGYLTVSPASIIFSQAHK